MRPLLIASVAFVAGFLVHWQMVRTFPPDLLGERAIDRHWKVVNDFNAYMLNPENYTMDPQTGLWSTDVPTDPDPSLAALVAAGELKHVDLVFPQVSPSQGVNKHWMQYVSQNRDTIVAAAGNPEYVAYQPAGDQPLHLQLWFLPSAKADVQRLISELEELAGDQHQTGKGATD